MFPAEAFSSPQAFSVYTLIVAGIFAYAKRSWELKKQKQDNQDKKDAAQIAADALKLQQDFAREQREWRIQDEARKREDELMRLREAEAIKWELQNSARTIKAEVEVSRDERRTQMEGLTQRLEETSKKAEEAIVVSNGVKEAATKSLNAQARALETIVNLAQINPDKLADSISTKTAAKTVSALEGTPEGVAAVEHIAETTADKVIEKQKED